AAATSQLRSGHARARWPPKAPGRSPAQWAGPLFLTWRGSSVRGTWQQRRPTHDRCSGRRSMLPEVQRGGWQRDERGAAARVRDGH
ncbi:unnamed protein product, partial [Ixodes hexagonus]